MQKNVANVSRQCDGIWYQDAPCENCRTQGLARAIYGRHLPPIPIELLDGEPIQQDRLYTVCLRCSLFKPATAEQQAQYETLNAPNLDIDDYDA